MELSPSYKNTEVGVIPEDWDIKTIGEIFTFYSTSNFSKAEMSLDGEVGCIHYGLIHAIDNTSYSLGNGIKYYISKEQAKYETIQNGDVVMVDASEDLIGINKSVEVLDVMDNDYIAGLHTFHLRDRNRIFVDTYRGLVLNSDTVKNQMQRLAVGMKVFGVSKPQLQQILVPVPKTTEQTAIAKALSDADALITSLEKLIAKKRNIKQGAMQELLQPKEGWEVKTYGEVFTFLPTATYSRAELTESGNVKYIHYGDIHTKWDSFLNVQNCTLPTIKNEQLKNYPFIKEGDLIMADASEDYNGIGKSIEVRNVGAMKIISGLHTFLLRDNTSVFTNGFRGYIHSCKNVKEQFDRLATGLKVYGVSKNNLKTVQIPVPPLEEQIRIATILSDMDNEITALEGKLEKYKKVKLGMMQNLLTGKIRLI